MSKLMLIDAVHPEETRVALVSGNQVDDFDFETAGKKQLRGNIYLAKVTRVEPSLQAAFVEYGGNRHGFLAFSEIHPDYYQLPKEDREALLAEEAARASAFEDDDDDDVEDAAADESDLSEDHNDESVDEDDDGEAVDEEGTEAAPAKAASSSRPAKAKRQSPSRRYKIQEVIRRRQIMLVQVVKEERGNKGAALTTYLSLAGRYGVLMPNTPRGGGISRKITSAPDRKRLKEIVSELDVPKGMGLIVRTAGAKRTKVELKRDYDYLIKLWEKIRENTMESVAPCLIHEEGNLVQRAMRDLFEKDIEEVQVQGDEAYRQAKDLAKLLMPSQARKVQQYKEAKPLFVEYGIEDQLDNIFSPSVKLKSGGYIVINQTEALVAIDVNSGKSTRERNIEQTALRTNLEAAEEACRQMRLRDLAGLVVIDFIDMEENKNVRAIEKKMKDCLKSDRARVQNGRISMFGLMEISRQRRRAGVLESTSEPCPTCDGFGRVRSVESASLQLLRALEARLAFGKYNKVTAEAPTEVALFLLNSKRQSLADLEDACGIPIAITSSTRMRNGDFTIEAERIPGSGDAEEKAARKRQQERKNRPPVDTKDELEVIDIEGEDADEDDDLGTAEEADSTSEPTQDDESNREGGRRRRRGRRGGRRRRGGREDGQDTPGGAEAGEPIPAAAAETSSEPAVLTEPAPEDGGALLDGIASSSTELLDGIELEERKPSRRRRGGRRRNRRRDMNSNENGAGSPQEDTVDADEDTSDEATVEVTAETPEDVPAANGADTSAEDPEDKPKSRRSRSRRRPKADSEVSTEDAPETDAKAGEVSKSKSREKRVDPTPEVKPEAEAKPEPAAETKTDIAEKSEPKRRGWWQRKLLG